MLGDEGIRYVSEALQNYLSLQRIHFSFKG